MKERLRSAAEHVSALGYTPAYIALYGSQNYGLAIKSINYHSDHDYKCIVLPSLRELVEGSKPVSMTVDANDGQIDIKDIRVFADVLGKMNPAYLECLASKEYWVFPDCEAVERMRELVPALMQQRAAIFARVCCGLFEEKAKQMCHPFPAALEKIKKYGYDGKQVHHMYRLMLMLCAFEKDGGFHLETPESERILLTDLKLNRIPLDEAVRMITVWRSAMREMRDRIENKYPVHEDSAALEITRLAREMIYAHCVKEAKMI